MSHKLEFIGNIILFYGVSQRALKSKLFFQQKLLSHIGKRPATLACICKFLREKQFQI